MRNKYDSNTPDPIDIAVGARIRAKRRLSDVSQQLLARSVGVTFQQIQKYEKGSNRVSASMLVHIAAALRTTACVLIGEVGQQIEPLVIARLSTPGAEPLLKAYTDISDMETRRSVLHLVQALNGPTHQKQRRRSAA
jgi:transcriptional regulator with XRE-family HTH domain